MWNDRINLTAPVFYRGKHARQCYDFAMPDSPGNKILNHLFAHWRSVLMVLALLMAMPTVYFANKALLQTRLDLDTRLIVEYRLWESDPTYAGSPRNWTRFASWLLDSDQLLERARTLYPAQADAIEIELHREALFTYGGVIARYLAACGTPFALAYAIGFLLERRRVKRSP
jgi:hypothetical protein